MMSRRKINLNLRILMRCEQRGINSQNNVNNLSPNKERLEGSHQVNDKLVGGASASPKETSSFQGRKAYSPDKGFKVQKKDNMPSSNPIPMIKNSDLEELSGRSVVCFSEYPLTGCILQEIIDELGYKSIMVKELSCQKFILTFQTVEAKEGFDFKDLKDWFIFPRNLEKEDFKVKKKALVEIRGLPCLA